MNPAIAMSFRNQFVPSINYTYTFDKTYGRTGNRRFYWQNSVTSAGNILSGVLSLFGSKQPQHLFGNRFFAVRQGGERSEVLPPHPDAATTGWPPVFLVGWDTPTATPK